MLTRPGSLPRNSRGGRVSVLAITLTALLLLAFATLGADMTEASNRRENAALLGVVTGLDDERLTILHVLAGSPAFDAGLMASDRLLEVNGTKLARPTDLDRALRRASTAEPIDVVIERGGETLTLSTTLMPRQHYRGAFVAPRARGATGFPAPAWLAYAWDDPVDDRPPPTRQNTAGKVVVIHAFQSW